MSERPDQKPPRVDGGGTSTPDAGTSRDPASGEETRPDLPREIGGRKGPEPTRFGDWEKNGRCIDF